MFNIDKLKYQTDKSKFDIAIRKRDKERKDQINQYLKLNAKI